MCESFFVTLERELVERDTFADRSEARLSVFEFIEGSCTPERLHSGIGYQSPGRYEEEYHSRDHSQAEEPHSLVAA
jgi:putative transposase